MHWIAVRHASLLCVHEGVTSPSARLICLGAAAERNDGALSEGRLARGSAAGTPPWPRPRPVQYRSCRSRAAVGRAWEPAMEILVVNDDPEILDALTVGMQLQWQAAAVLSADAARA